MAKKDGNNEKKNNFGKDLRAEMKKVTWPSLKELVGSTSAVISIVLIVAVIVFVLDVCFENLNKFGVDKLKTLVSSNAEEIENDEDISDDDELTTDGEGIIVDSQDFEETTDVPEETNQSSTDSETGEVAQ